MRRIEMDGSIVPFGTWPIVNANSNFTSAAAGSWRESGTEYCWFLLHEIPTNENFAQSRWAAFVYDDAGNEVHRFEQATTGVATSLFPLSPHEAWITIYAPNVPGTASFPGRLEFPPVTGSSAGTLTLESPTLPYAGKFIGGATYPF